MRRTAQRVLVVGDDPVFGAALMNQLKRIGCRSRTADRQEEAIDQLQKNPQIQVVLLGHDASGRRITEFVDAAKSIRADIRIIGCSVKDRRGEFTSAGVQQYLQIPPKDSDLMAALGLLDEPAERGKSSDTHFDHTSDTALLRFSRGQRVRVETGSMSGLTGVIVGKRSRGRLLLEIDVGVYLEIHQTCVSQEISAA